MFLAGFWMAGYGLGCSVLVPDLLMRETERGAHKQTEGRSGWAVTGLQAGPPERLSVEVMSSGPA